MKPSTRLSYAAGEGVIVYAYCDDKGWPTCITIRRGGLPESEALDFNSLLSIVDDLRGRISDLKGPTNE